MSEPVAELVNVSKVYGRGATEVRALDHLNICVNRGDFVAVMGASGSGKSTAIQIIGCLDRPTSGHYRLNGIPVDGLNDDELADLRNRELGFVFQQFHLLPNLSAIDNVMLPMVFSKVPKAERRDRALDSLEQVGLADRIHNRPNQLSGGQQQRVAIARAIVNRPALLLADEPTGALDSKTGSEVLSIFEELNRQGITVVVVTHEVTVANRAQKILHFVDGRLSDQCIHP